MKSIKYISSLKCIKIPVKISSVNVDVRHVSPLTSFSLLVFYLSYNAKRKMFSPLLLTGKCDRCVSNEFGTILCPFDVKI